MFLSNLFATFERPSSKRKIHGPSTSYSKRKIPLVQLSVSFQNLMGFVFQIKISSQYPGVQGGHCIQIGTIYLGKLDRNQGQPS